MLSRYAVLTSFVSKLTFCDGLPQLLEPLSATLRQLGKAVTAAQGAWAPTLQLAHMEARVAVQKASKAVVQRRTPLQVTQRVQYD